MNLTEQYKAILEKVKTENRSLTSDEEATLDKLKGEIEKAEKSEAIKATIEKREAELRSVAASQSVKIEANEANTFLRSLAKGSSQVGNLEFDTEVVRQFEETSPIFRNHMNVQKRSTGNAFSFAKLSNAGTIGAVKTEGSAGGADSASTYTTVSVPFT